MKHAAPVNNTNKKVIFKNRAPFTNSICDIDNTQTDGGPDIDIVMPMYNFVEYSDVYLKASGGLWQYYKPEPALDNNNNISDFPANNRYIIPLKFKQQIRGQTGNCGTKDVEKLVPIKYLSNFWRTLETPLIS